LRIAMLFVYNFRYTLLGLYNHMIMSKQFAANGFFIF